MKREGAEGKAEGDVVESVGFGGGGGLGNRDGDLNLLGHDVMLLYFHLEELRLSSKAI